MATKILMPELGESVIEGVVAEWFKQVGELLTAGEPLVLMETEKVTTEVDSPADGVLLQISAEVGATVNVGELLGWVGSAGEEVPAGDGPVAVEIQTTVSSGSAPVQQQAPAKKLARRDGKSNFISPVVARMAAEHDLDLDQISGSGKNGRVTKKDVNAFLANQHFSESADQPARQSKQLPVSKVSTFAVEGKDGELMPLSPMRKAIARNMVNSKQTVPHVTAVVEVDLKNVAAHRQAHKAAFAQDGIKLTFMAYFGMAVGQALKKHRIVNSSWTDDGIFLHRPVNIGIATDLGPKGLVVPVVKNVPDLSLMGIARAIGDMAERGRAGQLRPDEMQGGTYTLTNYGSNGTLMASPIINPPQCAILGLGKIERRPVVRMIGDDPGEEVVVIRPMIYITHTYDHRILDGGTSAAFMRDVVAFLEHFS